MSASSPTTGAIPTFVVKTGGLAIPDSYAVTSITVVLEAGKPAFAEIKLPDGDPSKALFPISQSDTFIPGDNISILIGYDGLNSEVFSGTISKHAVSIPADGSGELIVLCEGKFVEAEPGRAAVLTLVYGDSIQTFYAEAGTGRSTGRVSFQGSSAPKAGQWIRLEGISKRFNGEHPIYSVRHEISNGVWTTTVHFSIA